MAHVAAALMCLVFIGMIGGLASQAATLEHCLEFGEPLITADGEFVRLTLPGTRSYGSPGEPVLPIAGLQLLLPPGETIASVEVLAGEKITMPGVYRITPGQPERPISFSGPIEVVPPSAAIYESNELFPSRLDGDPREGLFRGYRIAALAVRPVQYRPASGQISYHRTLTVRITTVPDAGMLAASQAMFRGDNKTGARLTTIVANPEAAIDYRHLSPAPPLARDLDPDLGYTYLIVATEAWEEYLDPLVAFHTERGHKAGVFLKSWILANYTGGPDEQANIRAFLIDAYQTWNSDYVLLVGDARDEDGIPHRGLYSTTEHGGSDLDIPADVYYGCLDGTWNDDGDGLWGEPGEADLYPELGVGRACVSEVSHVFNFITKVTRYASQPVVADCDQALMVGEFLWDEPLTYGGTYKEEIRLGTNAHGYTTPGFPTTMNVDTLYDMVATWDVPTLINLLGSGVNIVNHLGHGSVDWMMRLQPAHLPLFHNHGLFHTYNFVYSQACYSGSFDDRAQPGSYWDDCISEQFQTSAAGAVAVVSNSRFGHADPGGTDGSSQHFDRQFFDAMFGEEIYPLGDVLNDSKMDHAWAIDNSANRWCFYQLNLFGDPAMHLWTAEPDEMVLTAPDHYILGDPGLAISVEAAGTGGPVVNAQVTVFTADYGVYDTGLTDAGGLITLDPAAHYPGTLFVKATAHDFREADGSLEMIRPSTPHLLIGEFQLIEPGGDEIVDAGDSVALRVMLRNVGAEDAYTVSATLASTDEHILITAADQAYPDIPAGEEAWCLQPHAFEVSPACPDLHPASLALTIEGQQRLTWDDAISFLVHAPQISMSSFVVDDSAGGNGNGRLDPRESADIAVTLLNSGSGRLDDILGVLSCANPLMLIDSNTGMCAGLGEDESGQLEPVFAVSVDLDFPAGPTEFLVDVSGSNAFEQVFSCSLMVGIHFEPVEDGELNWPHYAVTDGFFDQWHLSTMHNHTPGGSQSWRVGDVDQPSYDNLLDAALETPIFEFAGEGQLRFWMWIYAEASSSNPDNAYDGGLIEMSVDGGPFAQITPEGGYTHIIQGGGSPGPFPNGTPVFSGEFDWQEVVFDLTGITGSVVFRFRFGSDGMIWREGWHIDDLEFYGAEVFSGIGDGRSPVLSRLLLSPPQPNPAMGPVRISFELPRSSEVSLEIFDPAGRLVRALERGPIEAGSHVRVWDGLDQYRHPVSSGLYYYRLSACEKRLQRTVVWVR